MLYEVAIIERPTPKEAEDGGVERLVFGPVAVVANDEQAAIVTAVQSAQLDVDALRIEVLVRPFRR